MPTVTSTDGTTIAYETIVVDRVVDHAVQAYVDAFLLGEIARLHVGTDLEPHDDRLGRQRQVDVALGDRARGAPDHVDPNLVLRQLGQRVHERPDRTLDVGLTIRLSSGTSSRSARAMSSCSVGGRVDTISAARTFASRSCTTWWRRALVLDLADVAAFGVADQPS